MSDIRITTLPGEGFAIALMEYCSKVRETMSQPNRDRQDEIALRFLDFVTRMWAKESE